MTSAAPAAPPVGSAESPPAPGAIRLLWNRTATLCLLELARLRHDRTELYTRAIQSALFIAIFYGIQLIWERDFGILTKLLATPTPRAALVAGKAFAAGVRAISQVVVVLVLAAVLGVTFRWQPLSLLGSVAAVMLGSSFFASNALYPTALMPGWVQAIARVNPLSYEVNALRQLLLGLPGNLAMDFAALLGATVAGITAASLPLGRLAPDLMARPGSGDPCWPVPAATGWPGTRTPAGLNAGGRRRRNPPSGIVARGREGDPVRNRRPLALTSLVVGLALLAGACGSNQTSGASTSASGTPQQGGTLKLVGSSDVDHLDTASAYYVASYTLERAFTRQLFSYPATTDITKANSPAADVATEVPTRTNGGISADGKTWTIHLRSGVRWNTSPAREVTAQDFVLGLKRLCNPVSPVGAPGYYENTIVGMRAYCDGFANVGQDAASIKGYIDSHQVAGLHATNDKTLVIKLVQPASDFTNILAMPFASAAPVEYLAYVPDSNAFRQHTISDGPYQIVGYQPGKQIVLDRNPAWEQSGDPLRHQYVDHVQVTEGQDQGPVQQQIQAGTADMEWDTQVPIADIPQLQSAKDSRLGIFPTLSTNPYVVFNLQTPNNKGALANVKVRQALEYAINKVAVGQVYGGPSLNTPLDQVIPPGNIGYQTFNLYPTPENAGDPATCRQLLAQAGYPNGLVLTDVARNAGNHPAVAQSVQASLAKCGVTTKIVPVTQADYYGKYLNNPAGSRRGVWDITEPGWVPDWFGNNGRAVIEPLFDGRTYGPNSVDYGDYNNPKVNALIDKALATQDQQAAAADWHQADLQIMRDAAIVPIETQKLPLFHSSRVQNAIYSPFSENFDVTNLWVSGS